MKNFFQEDLNLIFKKSIKKLKMIIFLSKIFYFYFYFYFYFIFSQYFTDLDGDNEIISVVQNQNNQQNIKFN
jgi:hypothetical protein